MLDHLHTDFDRHELGLALLAPGPQAFCPKARVLIGDPRDRLQGRTGKVVWSNAALALVKVLGHGTRFYYTEQLYAQPKTRWRCMVRCYWTSFHRYAF